MGFKSLVPIHTWKHSLTAFSFLNLVFGAVGCLNAFPTSRAIICLIYLLMWEQEVENRGNGSCSEPSTFPIVECDLYQCSV
jgi:hypothetical protein